MPNHTASELLFEEYLATHGYHNWVYEPILEGKTKRLDYRVEHRGVTHFFEVKEFDSPPPLLGFGSFDPYGPIRAKINQATRQFKDYKEFPCSVVLANPNNAFVQLGEPWAIIGAMLGNLGFEFPVGPNVDEPVTTKTVFLGGGKMFNRQRRQPQNTTVSSIIVLGTYPLREKRIRVAIKERRAQLGRKTTLEEELQFYDAIPEHPDLRRVRVDVYENPHARIPHNRDWFSGKFDQRWGLDGKYIRRVYAGEEILHFERVLGET